MAKVILRSTNKERRKLRVKKKVFGEIARPRLSVFRSNKYIYGQIIDDRSRKTLIGLSATEIKKAHEGKTKVEAAFSIGEALALKALDKKIKKVVFDRNGYQYHGRIKNIADGARKRGLEL